MPKPLNLSQELFDRLLQWLGSTPELAGAKYQEAHRRLTRHFGFKGCDCPEDLADQVIDRVARNVTFSSIVPEKDRINVFYRYTKYVYLEYVRSRAPIVVVPLSEDIDLEKHYKCLDRCLQELAEPDRHLLLDYYGYAPGQKIQRRQMLAEDRKIALNALRIRVCRLRAALKRCIMSCIRSQESALVQ